MALVSTSLQGRLLGLGPCGQCLRRWNKNTGVPLYRRAEKVLRSLGWEMQVDFEHLTESELVEAGYLDAILKVMNLKAGVRDDDEKRQAFKDVIQGQPARRTRTWGSSPHDA